MTEAGAVSPHQLRDEILQHPGIELKIANITTLISFENKVQLKSGNETTLEADHVVVCCARESAALFENYPLLKPIRGQVSWVDNSFATLPLNEAYSYGGYCMQLNTSELILGASFYPNRDDQEVLLDDHVHNFELIHSVFLIMQNNYHQSNNGKDEHQFALKVQIIFHLWEKCRMKAVFLLLQV